MTEGDSIARDCRAHAGCTGDGADVSSRTKQPELGEHPCGVQDLRRHRLRPSQRLRLWKLVAQRTSLRSQSAGAALAKPSLPRSATKPALLNATISPSTFSIPTAAARPSRP